MSMGIGSSQSTVKRYELKDFNGNVVGVITVHKPTRSKSTSGQTKKKRLRYNFKEVSTRILKSKTSGSARQVVTMARSKLAQLKRLAKTGKYDDRQLDSAIIHAAKMVRIARKRMKHLQQEEQVKISGRAAREEKEKEDLELEDMEEFERLEELDMEGKTVEVDTVSQEEMLIQLMELQQRMAELEEQLLDEGMLEELNDEMFSSSGGGRVSEEELERLKKKHRAKEMQEIVDADMKYLKAMFDAMEKEQQETANAIANGTAGTSGVTLELGGVEVPVEASQDPLVMEVGGTVDTLA